MAVNKEKNKQILITIPLDMLDKIENYWRSNGFKNRNEGIRKLLEERLKEEE